MRKSDYKKLNLEIGKASDEINFRKKASDEINFRNKTENDSLWFHLRREAGKEYTIDIETLIQSFLSKFRDKHLKRINPCLSQNVSEKYAFGNRDQSSIPFNHDSVIYNSMRHVAIFLFHVTRVAQINKSISLVDELMEFLVANPNSDLVQRNLMIKKLENMLCMKRHHTMAVNGNFQLDPRFLVFEFISGFLLRKKQVDIIKDFIDERKEKKRENRSDADLEEELKKYDLPTSFANKRLSRSHMVNRLSQYDKNKSRVKQYVMGGGKTSVICPMLAMVLTDNLDGGKYNTTLVTVVVPKSLLPMTCETLEEKFSIIVRKQILLFKFSRDNKLDDRVLNAIKNCKNQRGVCCSSPSSIKSLMIKFIQISILEDGSQKNKGSSTEKEILMLFRSGIIVMDEVDLLLNPLKSELNFPIGDPNKKKTIDMQRERIEVPLHLFDAFLYTKHNNSNFVPGLGKFKSKRLKILKNLKGVIVEGINDGKFQNSPHLVLVDKEYYHRKVKPYMMEWLISLLKDKGKWTLKLDKDTLTKWLGEKGDRDIEDVLPIVEDKRARLIKLLNLAHQWLNELLPHCLSLINRIHYGLLQGTRFYKLQQPSSSRNICAVPFRAKDVPTDSSEFAHPDVLIGLTYLAYRHEGLSYESFFKLFKYESSEMRSARPDGSYEISMAAKRFNQWIELAGAFTKNETNIKKGTIIAIPDDSAPKTKIHKWKQWKVEERKEETSPREGVEVEKKVSSNSRYQNSKKQINFFFLLN